MSKQGFLEGVIVALVISIAGSVFYSAMSRFGSETQTVCYMIALINFVYCVYLLTRSDQNAGRIIMLICWLLMTIVILMFKPQVLEFILYNVCTIWMLRCLYHHSNLISAMLDLVLNILSVLVALWALFHSGSVFLSLWSFFLVQALFIIIPGNRKSSTVYQSKPNNNTKFDHALRLAQSAVDMLSRQTSHPNK